MKRDLRQYSRNTMVQLIIGSLIILLTLGIGLIYLIYGGNAAKMGLLCIAGAFVPILIIIGLLLLMDRIVKHANKQ